jgi:hypothetical protein
VFPIALFGGIVALIGGIGWIAYNMEKKRTAAVQMVAQTMGFSFTKDTGAEMADLVGALPVFDNGHSRKATRLMQGKLAGRDAAIFDYRYTTGGGKSSHTHYHTMVLFPEGATGLPDFSLAPENFLHRIAGVFGYQDIDFPEAPDFSKHYLLRGADEAAIRDTFNSEVLAFLGGSTGWQVQSSGGKLCVFREGRYAKPETLPSYAADALRIAGVFKRT